MFQKNSGNEKVYGKEVGGLSRFSVQIFLSHSAENFRRGELSSVSLFSGIEKNSRGGGSIKFSVEKFLSHNATHFRMGESFSVSLNSGIEKVWRREGGGCIKIFRRKFFLAPSVEKFP